MQSTGEEKGKRLEGMARGDGNRKEEEEDGMSERESVLF